MSLDRPQCSAYRKRRVDVCVFVVQMRRPFDSGPSPHTGRRHIPQRGACRSSFLCVSHRGFLEATCPVGYMYMLQKNTHSFIHSSHLVVKIVKDIEKGSLRRQPSGPGPNPKKPCLQLSQRSPSTLALHRHWPERSPATTSVRASHSPPCRDPLGSQLHARDIKRNVNCI